MKRGILLIVALLLLAALGTGVLALLPDKAGLPAGCQAALNQYLTHKNATLSEGLSVKSAVKAANPGRLAQDVSMAVYGGSLYYQTDQDYQTSSGDAEADDYWATDDRRPLPYPPEEVWCVLLERSAQTPAYGVAFVSLHQDIHNADWVVHEAGPDPFASVSIQVASDLGCDLSVDR
ncbi:MAG: hypothetical protein JXM73_00495 [Anaerolineae bacterium]|nr:hypothetical protein [Anaerolineae bacterium]